LEGLEYVSWVVRPDELFKVALETCDFDIIIMVAQLTQKDPKEYLPFLKQLQALPLPLMKHRIFIHLANYPKALKPLSKVN
jgi:elongator complex protein 1